MVQVGGVRGGFDSPHPRHPALKSGHPWCVGGSLKSEVSDLF